MITAWKCPQYQYEDKLKITGKLKEPETFEGFNYKDYLAKDEIYSVMYFPKIELIDKGLGNSAMRIRFSFFSIQYQYVTIPFIVLVVLSLTPQNINPFESPLN